LNPVCFVCGEERRGYVNPDHLADFDGFGSRPCSHIELLGRTGIIPKEKCLSVSEAAQGVCQCGDLPDDMVLPTNKLEVPEQIFQIESSGGSVAHESLVPPNSGPYSPFAQATVLEVHKMPIMYDQMSDPVRAAAIQNMLNSRMPVISPIVPRGGYYYERYGGYVGQTSSVLFYPVFDPTDTTIVGSVTLEMLWSSFMTGALPPQSEFVNVVVQTSCATTNHTYKIDAETDSFVFVGDGNFQDPKFQEYAFSSTYEEFEEVVRFAAPKAADDASVDYCRYRYVVYPTQGFYDQYINSNPTTYAIFCGAIFFFTTMVFVFYDVVVHARQAKVMKAATRTNNLVATLFPKEFRDRIYEAHESKQKGRNSGSLLPSKMKMQDFLAGDEVSQGSLTNSEPIADLFPHATVLFLDIGKIWYNRPR
jgi:hypothetical protein